MSQIPSAVDAMIWKLAETDDVAAQADFVSQYPELKDELSRRAALVRRLKDYPRHQPRLPRFTPNAAPVVTAGHPRWLVPAAVAVVLGGLAFATYAGVTYVRSTQAPDVTAPAAPAPVTEPHAKHPDRISHMAQPGGVAPSTPQTPPVNNAQPTYATRWDTPVSFEAKDATLAAVVLAISSGAHVSIKLAPGMPNPKVTLSATKQRAGSVLEELGKKYGFGVLYETDKYAVLIPLTPDSAPAPGQKEETPQNPSGVSLRVRTPGDQTLPAAPNIQKK